MFERQREQVAAASRRLAEEGLLIGTAGNVSAREGDAIAITATGAVLADLDSGQVTVVDPAGKPLAGELEPTSEIDLHLGIYEHCDAGAVVHTHSPMATAVALVINELPCVHYSMLLLGGDVRVTRYETFGTPELAEAVIEALDGRTAALMANHGAIAYGPDLPGAVERAQLLEWASALYLRASAIGTPRVLSDEQRQAVVEAAIARGYGKTKRLGAG